MKIIKTGVVIEKNGKYWGVQYKDGSAHVWGFGKLDKARVFDPKWLKTPESATYKKSPYIKELIDANIVPIKIVTDYQIG